MIRRGPGDDNDVAADSGITGPDAGVEVADPAFACFRCGKRHAPGVATNIAITNTGHPRR